MKEHETWKGEAQFAISQMVSQSRFDSFVSSCFVETEQRSLKALPAINFEAFVATRFAPIGEKASQFTIR